MDYLIESNKNIKVLAHLLELKSSGYNSRDKLIVLPKHIVCTCCLVKNVPFISLATCKHKELLVEYFKINMENDNALVCLPCHSLLKKISAFRELVAKNIIRFNQQPFNCNAIRTTNLKCSKTRIISIDPILTNAQKESKPLSIIKIEKITTNDSVKDTLNIIDIEVEIPPKFEPENDWEASIPASQVKMDVIEEKPLEPEPHLNIIKMNKLKRVEQQKELVEDPLMKLLAGKVQKVLINRDGVERERKKRRKSQRYINLKHKCEDCIIGFEHELGLANHMKNKHSESIGDLRCDICKSVYRAEASLKKHYQIHYIRYECVACGELNSKEWSCIAHYNLQHGEEGGVIPMRYECKLVDCDFVSENHCEYIRHLKAHRVKPQCKICGNVYANTVNLKLHMDNVHNRSAHVYKCEPCDKTYKSPTGLSLHMRSVHSAADDAPQYCAPCRMHFRNKYQMRQHLRAHSNHVIDANKKFVCDLCGERFVIKPQIRSHIEVKHMKIEHKCTQCPKVFNSRTALKRHTEYVHDKKRPLLSKMCDYCGRAFSTQVRLTEHIRTHTGERPLQCSTCSATFAFSAALYMHNRLVHKKPKIKK